MTSLLFCPMSSGSGGVFALTTMTMVRSCIISTSALRNQEILWQASVRDEEAL